MPLQPSGSTFKMPAQTQYNFTETDMYMFNNHQPIISQVDSLILQSHRLTSEIIYACDQTQQGHDFYLDVFRQMENVKNGLQIARVAQERPNQVAVELNVRTMITVQQQLLEFFRTLSERDHGANSMALERANAQKIDNEDQLNDLLTRLAEIVSSIHMKSCPYTTGRAHLPQHQQHHHHQQYQQHSGVSEGWNGNEQNALRWVGCQTKEDPSILVGNAGYDAREIPHLTPTKAVIENCDFGKGLMLQVGHTKSTDFFNRNRR